MDSFYLPLTILLPRGGGYLFTACIDRPPPSPFLTGGFIVPHHRQAYDISLPLFNPVTFLHQSLVWMARNSDAALAPFLRNDIMQGCALGMLTAA